MSERNDVAMAASIEIGSCACPQIHILLKDGDGTVFAAAAFPLDIALRIAEDIVDCAAKARKRQAADAIGQCEGHA